MFGEYLSRVESGEGEESGEEGEVGEEVLGVE